MCISIAVSRSSCSLSYGSSLSAALSGASLSVVVEPAAASSRESPVSAAPVSVAPGSPRPPFASVGSASSCICKAS
eukprot:5025336-Lingulodinium_polyedra.AAC.1